MSKKIKGKIKRIGKNSDEHYFGIIENADGTKQYFNGRSLSAGCQFKDLSIGDNISYDTYRNDATKKQFVQNIIILEHDNTIPYQIYNLLLTRYRPGDTIDIADLRHMLIDADISYHSYDYPKIEDFFNQFPEFLSISDQTSNTGEPPSFVTFLKPGQSVEDDIKAAVEQNDNEKSKSNTYKPSARPSYREPELFKWAYVPSYSDTLEKLKNMALSERWDYSDSKSQNKLLILDKYLKYTFQRLTDQDNGIIETDDYAAFNTGLVDKKYKSIYALFVKNSQFGKHENSTQQWRFQEFCVDGEYRSGKELVKNFAVLPERARYFEQISDMLFDPTSERSISNEHILIDNINRLPEEFHHLYCPKDFVIKDLSAMHFAEKDRYFDTMRIAIINDEITYRAMNTRLNEAINLAIKKAEWNFKTAIPMYYPTEKTMSLLLPLAVMADESVDVALVVEKCKSGRYLGHTILTLDMAYSNARLISRPDSDWLSIENIDINHVGINQTTL